MRTKFDNKKPVCIALGREKEDIMRKVMLVAIMIMIIAFAGSAMAATLDIAVQANVVGTCRIVTAGPLSVDFGDLTYNAGTGSSNAATLSASLDYWCTNGATYTITSAGANDASCTAAPCMMFGASEIPYTATATDSGTGTGAGPAAGNQTIDVQIDIAAGAADNASIGLHTDTLTITVVP